MPKKSFIAFDEKTKATMVELKRNLDFFNAQISLICQTVLNMNGEDPNDGWVLTPDLSGLMKTEENEKRSKDQNEGD